MDPTVRDCAIAWCSQGVLVLPQGVLPPERKPFVATVPCQPCWQLQGHTETWLLDTPIALTRDHKPPPHNLSSMRVRGC
eukprot:725586-Pelagomonas_calceolata.AAC.2